MKKEASSTVKETAPSKFVSLDAPPLDFSFRQIKNLEEILSMKPHQGRRKPIVVSEPAQDPKTASSAKKQETNNSKAEQNSKPSDAKPEQQQAEKPVETKLEIVRTIEVSSLIATQVMNQNTNKSKNEPEKATKKTQQVELVPTSLFLSYNKIRTIANFSTVVEAVFLDIKNLKWIDLSHNYLTTLDYDFKHTPGLKTLYLHKNYLKDFQEINKLKHLADLKILTIHANPLQNHTHCRSIIIGILPELTKIDSVLVTKREMETSQYYLKSMNFKKLPVVQTTEKPPTESDEQGAD